MIDRKTPTPRKAVGSHSATAFSAALSSLAVALSLALMAAPQPVRAQEAATQINIQRQSLSDALLQLGQQTSLQFIYTTDLVREYSAEAVSGRMAPEEALRQLLAGTGIQYSREGNTINLWRAAETTQLAPVTVTGSNDGMTEGTGSYTTSSSSTATKLNLSLRETPQTVTVVSRQKMDDFGLTTVHDVLESTSGVNSTDIGHAGPEYYIRGFLAQSQYDGIPNPIGIGDGNRAATPDTAFLDKVEILQGASGLMSGAGEPGGTINLIRKRPTRELQSRVEASVGSWDQKRLVGDISGSLTESERVRGRLVAAWNDENSYSDYVFKNRKGLYGIVEADLTDTTTVGFSLMYQKDKFNGFYGVPMGPGGEDLGLSRSSFFGIGNAESDRESTIYSFNIDQELPASWTLKANYTHADTDVNMVSSYLEPTTISGLDMTTGDGLVLARALMEREFSSDAFDVYASGPFDLFGRDHELVLGGSYSKMKDRQRLTPRITSAINVYDFNPGSLYSPAPNFPEWPDENETEQSGIYAATRLNISNRFKVILGSRLSWYEYARAGTQNQKESSILSPYGGLLYDIDDNHTVYASYSDIFKPQSYLTVDGGTVDPLIGKNYEIGLKSELYDGRLNFSAAIFRLEQKNIAEQVPNMGPTDCFGSRCYTASGLIVSNGLDLGLNGELSHGWQIGLGYTYVQSEYGNGDRKGESYRTYLPKHSFRAYTSYRIPESSWTVGGDIRVQSRIYVSGESLSGENSHVQQGGYALFGLMARYQFNKQAEVILNVNNLFDRRYYDTISRDPVGSWMENFFGAPRNFAINLKYAF